MISISDSAKKHIEACLQKENKLFFYITIKKMGCSGYAFQVSMKNEKAISDLDLEINNLPVLIDKTWISILENAHIDYIEDAHSPLKSKKFVFSHPNIEEHCGCGESFYISGK